MFFLQHKLTESRLEVATTGERVESLCANNADAKARGMVRPAAPAQLAWRGGSVSLAPSSSEEPLPWYCGSCGPEPQGSPSPLVLITSLDVWADALRSVPPRMVSLSQSRLSSDPLYRRPLRCRPCWQGGVWRHRPGRGIQYILTKAFEQELPKEVAQELRKNSSWKSNRRLIRAALRLWRQKNREATN